MLKAIVLGALVAATPLSCGAQDQPGQGDYRATLTVYNRTDTAVELTSGTVVLAIPPCSESTITDFPINHWDVSGSDALQHSGGGHDEAHSYLIVEVDGTTQVPTRPGSLPDCSGRAPSP